MRVDLFDFELPEEQIALRPVAPRDAAKLLVIKEHGLQDRHVCDLADMLQAGDALVFNDTKVIPAQLEGTRTREDGAVAKVSATLHTRLSDSNWLCFAKGSKKLRPGDRISFGHPNKLCLAGSLDCTVKTKDGQGNIELAFDFTGAVLDDALSNAGAMPLPPYIASKRPADEQDSSDYQTVYADEPGAVAAPTAGLHFTPELMERLEQKGVSRHFVTLHVGPGTFLPMKVEDTDDHQMHSEWGQVSKETAASLNQVRQAGGKIVCVGTTSLRLIESAAEGNGTIREWRGDTDIFITPGYRFSAVDVLMTNFHLPKSTLFMLVSAFCGLETMQSAYTHAIENQYRFYSYGDASLLFRSS